MPKVEGKTDLFGIALKTLAASYDYLPVIGRAAQAGYATGKFDAQAWFGYRGEFQLRPITLTQVIARRNAAAVILLEWSYRQAWKDAQGAGTSQPNAK